MAKSQKPKKLRDNWNDTEFFNVNSILLNHAHWAINHYANLITNLQSRASSLMGFTIIEIGFLANAHAISENKVETNRLILIIGLLSLLLTLVFFILCNLPRVALYPNLDQIRHSFLNLDLKSNYYRPLESLLYKSDDNLDLFEKLAKINNKSLVFYRIGVSAFISSQIFIVHFIISNWGAL